MMPLETIAIVMGVSYHRQDEVPPLPAAERDAINFARALRSWGIPEHNILLSLNKEVNQESIDNLLTTLTKSRNNYKLIFYFCGHGHRSMAKIPKSYLILHEDSVQEGKQTKPFSLDCFFDRVYKTKATEIYVFIDACHLRVNHFVNPKLEDELNGKPTSDKGLFCLFSSGIEASFENAESHYGYFTRALLRGLCRIRTLTGSPTQFLDEILKEMKADQIPLPEMVNFGIQKISLTPSDDFFVDTRGTIYRNKVIAEIQEAFIQTQSRVIFLFGEEGCGKTTICQSLASDKLKILYLSLHAKHASSDPIAFLERRIEQKFGCSLDELNITHPFYLIIIDQLEGLSARLQHLLFMKIQRCSNLRFICVSRQPLERDSADDFDPPLLQISVPPLSFEEALYLIRRVKPAVSEREAELIYLISQGNPLKIKKISLLQTDAEALDVDALKKAIAAVYACDVYYNKSLFEKLFGLQPGILDFFEANGSILLLEEGFTLHPFLKNFAESKNLVADPQTVLTYWLQQAKELPSHPKVAKSLILACKCFGLEKKGAKALNRAIEALAVNEENSSYFIDAAELFLSHPYRAKISNYLVTALKGVGHPELAEKILHLKKISFYRYSILILLFFSFVAANVYFMPNRKAASESKHIHIKQTHPDFVGRKNYLELLENKLIHERIPDNIPIAVLWGEGGIGKSEIAIAFANQQIDHFDIIHWIDAATQESCVSSFQHLAAQLGITIEPRESSEKLIRKIYDYLEKGHLTWLLIYDNAEKEHEFPQRGSGAIIVTTRDQSIWHSYPHDEVTPFSEREALALFKKITGREETPYQRALIKELDNYPLSLNLAAHYVAETPWIPEKSYITLLSDNKVAFLDTMHGDNRYPSGLLDSWKRIAHHLQEQSPIALAWLHFCAYLHPDRIPFSWIEEWLKQLPMGAVAPHLIPLKTNEIMHLIVSQSLVRLDKNRQTLSIHRLKQEMFKQDDYFDSKTEDHVLAFLTTALEKFERSDEMERTTHLWTMLQEWELHAAWFLERHSPSCSKADLALLNNLLGSWKTIRGDYALAQRYIDQALKLRLELFGQEDLRTLVAMNNKGWILWKLGRLEEARSTYQEAIAHLKNIEDNEHLLNNLTLVLRDLHEYEAMKRLCEQVLTIRLKKYGKDNSYTADSMHNLAVAYQRLEECDRAKDYFEQSLDIYKSLYGEEHPYVAITMHNLARTLLCKKEYQYTEEILTRVSDLYAKYYGKEHPHMGLCLQTIGQLLEKVGRERESLEAFKRALSYLSKAYPQEHHSILSLLGDLRRLAKSSRDPAIFEAVNALLNSYLNASSLS